MEQEPTIQHKTSYYQIAGEYYLIDKNNNFFPKFTLELRQRARQKLAVNIMVSGEAGIGKSMMGIQIAQCLKSIFDVEKQVVYTYSKYIEAVMELRRGLPILFDEPTRALGHRTWYNEAQQVLVKTMESQRFMGHPVILPIINPVLIDKTVRNYLVQYIVHVYSRGKAIVYRLKPSQREDKTYWNRVCKLEYPLLSSDLCKRDSCLGCGKLNECNILRGQYERKKRRVVMDWYKEDKAQSIERESKEITIETIVDEANLLRNKFVDSNNRIDVQKLRVVMRMDKSIILSLNKAYEVKANLIHKYPDEYVETVDV